MLTLSQAESFPSSPPAPQPAPAREVSTLALVAGGAVLLGLAVGIGALYNRWAYNDWTCMFKHCVQIKK